VNGFDQSNVSAKPVHIRVICVTSVVVRSSGPGEFVKKTGSFFQHMKQQGGKGNELNAKL